jgi:hypothetical protein
MILVGLSLILSVECSKNVHAINKVAIFIQAAAVKKVTNNHVWDDILTCVTNVGKAQQLTQSFSKIPWENVKQPKPFVFDVIVSLPPGVAPGFDHMLKHTGASHVHVLDITENVGMDIKQFIDELEVSTIDTYDYFLKIHSKTDSAWRQRSYDSLCGSPAQVLTVLGSFEDKTQDIGVVVPQGMVMKKSTALNTLFSPFRDYYGTETDMSEEVFSEANIKNMRRIYKQMFQTDLDPDERKYVCAAGTMFWAQYDIFRVKEWVSILPWLANEWIQGYVQDEGVEHAIERLFVTIPYLNGHRVAEIIPAPKPIGIYYPQYHRTPEGDVLHGKGFTDWSLLKPSPLSFLAKPLPVKDGGLGYYDLTDVSVRRRQGELAREAGLHGFMYHHYWFAGNSSFKYKNPVMGKIPKLMLKDGEPNLPFMFSWANEPWTSTWSGGDGGVFLPQNYGGREEWTEHFNYLLPFFRHPKYIRVNNKPAFAIHRIGLMKDSVKAMRALWDKLAAEAGLPGLHIIYTLNNFVSTDKMFKSNTHRYCDASFQSFPSIAAIYPAQTKATSMDHIRTKGNHMQYWGGFTGFSNQVRGQRDESWARLVPPTEFKSSLRSSFQAMGQALPVTSHQVNSPNLFFINAWNEWNQQAQLEPSNEHGFAYLSAVKANVEEFPMILLE